MIGGPGDHPHGPAPAAPGGWVEATASPARETGPWWREAALVAALIVGLTCLFNYEVVFLGRTFFPLQGLGVMGWDGAYGAGPFRPDVIRLDPAATRLQNGAWAPEIRRQAHDGVVPLWNPNQGFGSPLHANAIPAQLNPFQALKLIDNSILTWDALLLARTMLGALAMYLLARLLGFAPAARAMAVLAFVFCGHFLLFDLNMWIEAYLVLPVILLGQELILRGSLRPGILITAVAVAGQLLVGMPEISLAVLLLAAAYGGIGMIRLPGSPAARDSWRRQAASLAVAWLSGIGLAAPLLIPLFELVGESGSMTGRRAIFGLDFAGLEDFSLWIMPYLSRLPYLPPLTSEADILHGLHYLGTFSGSAVFLLAIYGVLSAPRTVYRRLGYFLAIAVLLILAKSFGLPGLNELGRLPGMSITHIPKWFGPVVNFCLALLAAIAVHHLATTRRDESPRAANVAGLVTLAVAGLGVALNWGAIAEIDPAIAWLPWFSVATALVFGAATWWIVRFRPGSRIIPPAIACVLLVAGELFVLAPKGVRQDREEPFREPPYIAFLADQPDAATARVLGLGAILFPNAATAFGIPDIRALDALYSDRYLTYIQEFISPGSTNRFTGLEQTPDGQPPEVAGNTWLDLTGVRYVMAPPALAGLLFPTISVDSVFSSLATAKVDELGANLAPMTIGRDTRAALQQERPGAFSYRVAVPKDQPRLTLAIGAIPGAGRDRDAAPVLLRTAVTALRGDTSEILFDEDLKFRGDPGKNAWFETGLDLGAYAGETITLRFSAKPSRDSVFTALGWANLAFAEPGRTGPQHAPVYEDGSVTIVENADAFPRAFLVGHVKPVASQAEAIASMRDLALDMRETAVVEGDPAELSHLATPAPDQAPPGDASIVDYGPSHVGIETRADNPALLILTDLYYPGWSATIDGKPAPIHAVDLAFRGVAVPAGTHRVDFTYAPGSFRVGLFAGLGAAITLVAVAASALPARRRATSAGASTSSPPPASGDD